MPGASGAAEQAGLARALLASLDAEQSRELRRGFTDVDRRVWSYLPGERSGLALHETSRKQQQAVLRLAASVLSSHSFAQVAAVLALEDVLDLAEGGSGRRHRGDYWLALFGEPGDARWGWRFEGHHVSVNVTVTGDAVRVAPLFLGANPAAVRHNGVAVLRPLAEEEDVARALLAALDPAARRVAVRSQEAPVDIRTGRAERVGIPASEGIAAGDLPDPARGLVHKLIEVYLDRLAGPAAAHHRDALAGQGWDGVRFSWRGSTELGRPHYYQLTGPRLLVEYDNTQNGANHVHSVLRDPQGDFGADLLAEHYIAHH